MNEETYPKEENAPEQEDSQLGGLNEAATHEPPSEPAKAPGRSPWLWVGLGLLALVVVAVIVIFSLDLPGRLTGKLDAAAAAMPADTTVYMGVNLLQLTPAKLDRLLKPILAEVEETEFEDTTAMLAELDKNMRETFDFTFTDDIQPWMGQYLGLGLAGDFLGDYGLDLEDVGFILAIEARDKKAADDFLKKLRTRLVEQSDKPVEEQEYQGVTIYTQESQNLVFGRSKGLVLFGLRLEDLQAAIDSQNGDSLADNADFRELRRQLPAERFLTIFVDGEKYLQMLSQGMSTGLLGAGSLGQLTGQMQSVGIIAASLGIVDEGLRMDAIAGYDVEELSETQQRMLQNAGQATRIAEVMPADTMLLLAGQGLNNIMQLNKDTLGEQMGGDYDEAMQMLEAELGFNLDTDLLAYLEGEYGLAVVPEPESLLSQMGVPVGLIFVSHISDHDRLESTIQKFNQVIRADGATVKTTESGEDHLYTLGDPFLGEMVTYGLGQDYLALGLSKKAVENVFNPDEILAGDSQYQEIWTHFPNGSIPVLYVKLGGLLEAIRGSMSGDELESYDQSVAFLKPVTTIAMSTSPISGNQVRSTLIVFVEEAK